MTNSLCISSYPWYFLTSVTFLTSLYFFTDYVTLLYYNENCSSRFVLFLQCFFQYYLHISTNGSTVVL